MSTKHIVDNLSGQTITGQPILRPYKSYAALLAQSGASNAEYITSGDLTIGVTYTITPDGIHEPGYDYDFTNVGAPNNDIGTSFVATGTNPNSWGTFIYLDYDTATPVVTVLENTIGNIWFEYLDVGSYYMKSNRLFGNVFPVIINNIDLFDVGSSISQTLQVLDTDTILIRTSDVNALSDDFLVNTPIEIRVYN